jgi:hypothetical protein
MVTHQEALDVRALVGSGLLEQPGLRLAGDDADEFGHLARRR